MCAAADRFGPVSISENPPCRIRRTSSTAPARSIRVPCPKCDGRGWIETGADMVPSHDIALSPDGRPMWVVRLDPSDDIE
ncbi:MAG: hypothetical protein JHC57_13710 [Sphingopyxis sp.]|uniref:hypothetical protein n=1 Tax=Sphingopyxis sp. TaxID=1908224 RepID=UPI001A1A9752|nr:hypothetical protein [Sphingopyxis sp.]MBJ7500802.1 hypothetical protein [Sphingopyxis sp.]